jgi:hypothetical protein
MIEYKCKKCGKEEFGMFLPYQWSEIHEVSADVHDSACIVWESDYSLCPDCRMVFN